MIKISLLIATAIMLFGFVASAAEDVNVECQQPVPCDDYVKEIGTLRQIGASPAIVRIKRDTNGGRRKFCAPLPVCVQYGDEYEILAGDVGEDVKTDVNRSRPTENAHVFPAPSDTRNSSVTGTLFGSLGSIFARVQPMTIAAAGRGADDTACPSNLGAPPLQQLASLPASTQQIGSDLTRLLVMWKTSEPPQHVHIALTDAEGQVLQRAGTCRNAYVFIPVPQRVRHPGTQLAVHLTDEQGGKLDFTLDLVDPAELAQPSAAMPEPWQVATWRLTQGPANTRLDSLARLAKATDVSAVAEQVLGAVAADSHF